MLNIIIIPPVQCQATVEYIKNIKKMNLEKKQTTVLLIPPISID